MRNIYEGIYDVVILGAGVAGCYVAQLLRKRNIDVLLIDKKDKKKPDSFKDDSGIVSSAFLKLMEDIGDMIGFNSSKRVVRDSINKMDFISPSGKTIAVSAKAPFALMLNKQIVEQNLQAGLRIRNENVWKIDMFADYVHVWTDKNDYKCKMIVGADGADSFVRKQLGFKENKNVYGILLRTKKRILQHTSKAISYKDNNRIRVFLNKDYSDGFFAWHVPKNKEFGLIVGSGSGKNSSGKNNKITNKTDFIENLKKDMNLLGLKPEHVKMTSAPIPIGLSKSYGERCLLVGDAASQTKPLTGGGIVFAFRCCKHAASVIEDAIKADDLSSTMLKRYEKLWHEELGKIIKKQLLFRRIYKKMSNNDIERMFYIIGNGFDNIDLKDYDNPVELWKSLSVWKRIRISLIGIKGLVKSAF